MSRTVQRRWPLQPLLDVVDGETLVDKALRLPVAYRTLLRWKIEGGIPDSNADRLAVYLDLHPLLVWPDWNDAVEVEGGNDRRGAALAARKGTA